VKALAKISSGSPVDRRAGTLRRRDLKAFDALLVELGGGGTVLITGAAERKRAGAIGLAAAAAAGGTRTALLECDLAAPALAAELGLVAEPGLHEYLRWEATATQILQGLALAGPGAAAATEPLVCIVAGRPSPDGRVLLASDGFRHATERLSAAYELVVLDGPSLERDPAQLEAVAARADTALACVDSSNARGSYARRLRRLLRQMPPRFAGLVAFE
jgi:Mrp family chromosome partitioning ATPase